MTATILAAGLIAANPGPAAHIALLGAVIIIGLIVFAIVRLRRQREEAEADKPDEIGNITRADDEQEHDPTRWRHHHCREPHRGEHLLATGGNLSSALEESMRYLLLGYDNEGALEALAGKDKRALHQGQVALHDEHESAAESPVSVLAHFRFRPASQTTTIRLDGDAVVRSDGPAVETREGLRALYLLESDDLDAVVEFASRLPAVRMGGGVEVWPLIEPHVRSRS